MDVGLDKTRHHIVAATIEDLGVGGRDGAGTRGPGDQDDTRMGRTGGRFENRPYGRTWGRRSFA
jgi:hypothetical protein